jgi:hypothetical protein
MIVAQFRVDFHGPAVDVESLIAFVTFPKKQFALLEEGAAALLGENAQLGAI